MQKKILIAILSLLLLQYSWAQKEQEPARDYKKTGSILPAIRAVDTFNHVYSGQDFQNGHSFFLVMFNPTCGHCIDMAKMMQEHIGLFQQNRILFLAGAQMMPYLSHFYEASGLSASSGITVAVDSAGTIERLYDYKALPQINIYNEKGQLQQVFYGDTPLDSLKLYAK